MMQNRDLNLPSEAPANRRRISLSAATLFAVLAFAVTAGALSLLTFSGIQSRTQTLNSVAEETATLKLYEDVRSAGFAESAAAASYLGLPRQEFLDRFSNARSEVDASIDELRELVPAENVAQLQQIDDLDQRHTELAGTYDEILAALQGGDETAAFQLAQDANLSLRAGELWDTLDATIVDARASAVAAQRDNASSQKSLDRLVLITVVTWTIVLAGAGVGLYQWVVGPIRQVARAAGRITSGTVEARSPVVGPKEVAGLAEDVNSMADSLIERSQQIEGYLSLNLEARTTELEHANQALEQSERRFRSLVQNAPDLITVVDVDTQVLYQSPSIARILGYEADDLIGTRLSEIVHEEDISVLLRFFQELMTRPDDVISVEARLHHRDGSWRHLEIVGSDQRMDAVAGIVLNGRDVTDRKAVEEELRYQAFQDSLTDLANRASFTNRLEHATERAERTRHTIAVLFIDLDNFKAINDSFGHAAGDDLLRDFAKRVQSCLRGGDTAARLGGDEFAVLLEDLENPDRATGVAERILDALRAPFAINGKEVFARASIGVATSDAAEQLTAEGLLRNADIAMYSAKSRGKAHFEVYEESMHLSLLHSFELLGDLRSAVEHNQFRIQYQPTVDLKTNQIVGFEALVRWQHPRHGLIMPDDFISLAEESGVIQQLGRWVLLTACQQMSAWHREAPDGPFPTLAVNVSVQQLASAGFVEDVRNILQQTGLDPTKLTLEVTETITMDSDGGALSVLKRLKELDVRLAIDDFGMGSSSFAYLQEFPFDIVKIDKSFVQTGSGAGNRRELTRKVIELGKVLKLEVIAEGIEETGQLADLRDMDCAIGQGFLFAKPLDPNEVTEHLRRNRTRDAA